MLQVLFHVPLPFGWFAPDGFPVPGFGIALFVAFAVVTGWGALRTARVGLPQSATQDLAIVLFLTGIAGARVLYLWQYKQKDFPNHTFVEMIPEFFKIWNGGIVFYGSIFGGLIGYYFFRRLVLKRLGVSGWQLVDAIAPVMAIGMAIGRIGCFVNGCCWGQVACEECQPVPLSAELGRFPLLPSHPIRQEMPGDRKLPPGHLLALQTAAGFTVTKPDGLDPRSVVESLEPGSEAATFLRRGDRIVEVNGKPNRIVLDLAGPASAEAEKRLAAAGGDVIAPGVVAVTDLAAAKKAVADLTVRATPTDELDDLLNPRRWPRGQNSLTLKVERDGTPVTVKFTPRTLSFFPTQIYETVSMILLCLLLLAFQPFRRHDGQVIVVLMVGYAVHRFLNESIRIEPSYSAGFTMTLSQWISVCVLVAAVGLELYLRLTQPKLPPGAVPLGWKPATT